VFGFLLGKVVYSVEQYSNNVEHLVVIIVKEDNFVRGQELREEAYRFLRFDLASRLYREIIGHSKLSPIMMNLLALLLPILYMKSEQKSSVLGHFSLFAGVTQSKQGTLPTHASVKLAFVIQQDSACL
jgi:hypothetical protein